MQQGSGEVQEGCRRGAGEVRRGAGEVRGAMQAQDVTTSDSFILKALHRFAFVLKWFEVSFGEPSNLERCREERCSRQEGRRRGQERCRNFRLLQKMAGVKVALSCYKTPTLMMQLCVNGKKASKRQPKQ